MVGGRECHVPGGNSGGGQAPFHLADAVSVAKEISRRCFTPSSPMFLWDNVVDSQTALLNFVFHCFLVIPVSKIISRL